MLELANRALALAAIWTVAAMVYRQVHLTQALRRESGLRRRADSLAFQRQHDQQELVGFLRTVVHDLKHPVISVRLLLSLLQQDLGSKLDADTRENLDLALQECQQMNDMLTQLGALTKIESQPVVQEVLSLRQLLEDAVRGLRPRLEARRDLAVHIVAPEAPVAFSRAQVDDALRRLLDNALAYGCRAPAARLELSASLDDDEAVVTVRDDGPGIAEEQHERIFQIFQRLDPNGPVPGVGVGLTAVRRLMRRVGGGVDLDSAPGQGAAFTLRFPLVARPVTAPLPSTPPAPSLPSAAVAGPLASSFISLSRKDVSP